MTAKRLKINTDKTYFIWLGSEHQLAKIHPQSIVLEAVHVHVSSVVACLGVQFDSQLTFTPHIQGLARRCFYHLRQLRSVRWSLTTGLAQTLGARTDSQSSRLLQQCVISDHRHKDPPVSFALGCTTHNAEAQV